MAQLPTTYEEFLALPWEDKARMNMFCVQYNIQEITKHQPLVGDDDWDFPESPDPVDDWEYEIGEGK